MSIESALKAEGLDFPYMNPPELPDGQAYISYDKNNSPWVTCPWCGKRQFPLSKGAVIKGQVFKCKGSNCKQKFMVNLEG